MNTKNDEYDENKENDEKDEKYHLSETENFQVGYYEFDDFSIESLFDFKL
jgi:hypothetical protein